jgi:3-oxoacyl-[acyl-carrier protein] reductase
MQMLSRCLALALAPEITVNTVAPGIMDTRWGERWGQEALDRMAREAPLKRYPTLQDIAAAAVFLCENDSMTGQTIVVDAGRHMPL